MSLWAVDESLAECLVGPEAHDGQTERVHGQLVVFHVLAEDVGDAGCPSLPLEFGMIRRFVSGYQARVLSAG